MKSNDIHVFVASFPDEAGARAYSQEQWEPEPSEDGPTEEYEAWDDRNPSWQMQKDLGDPYLDSDLIETVWGTEQGVTGVNWEYLTSVIGSENAAACKRAAPHEATTLILISDGARGGFPFEFRSTSTMLYCGAFPSRYG